MYVQVAFPLFRDTSEDGPLPSLTLYFEVRTPTQKHFPCAFRGVPHQMPAALELNVPDRTDSRKEC
jgi:hypothetical protein